MVATATAEVSLVQVTNKKGGNYVGLVISI